jgi:hypothetical protein
VGEIGWTTSIMHDCRWHWVPQVELERPAVVHRSLLMSNLLRQ